YPKRLPNLLVGVVVPKAVLDGLLPVLRQFKNGLPHASLLLVEYDPVQRPSARVATLLSELLGGGLPFQGQLAPGVALLCTKEITQGLLPLRVRDYEKPHNQLGLCLPLELGTVLHC